MNRLSAIALSTLVACSCGHDDRLPALQEAAAGYVARVDNAVSAQRRIAATWDEVVVTYREAGDLYRPAQADFRAAGHAYQASAAQFEQASVIADRAANSWRLFQSLLLVAAAVDVANLTTGGAATSRASYIADCGAAMSTATYRGLLVAAGQSVVGMDVDHIVPKSFGGADHPLNYRLLASSLNRRLGNIWDTEKCLSVGVERCSAAIAVSRQCGSLVSAGFF